MFKAIWKAITWVVDKVKKVYRWLRQVEERYDVVATTVDAVLQHVKPTTTQGKVTHQVVTDIAEERKARRSLWRKARRVPKQRTSLNGPWNRPRLA